MTYQIHKSNTRGEANHGWLKAKHYFSFASYYNPERMGFGTLRVINDDLIEASKGFDTHPHENMEIITVPLTGALWHKDSMGNASKINAGEVQLMSAGTGVRHSEYNHSKDQATTLLQIWVHPKERDIEPRYDQQSFSKEARENQIQYIVSPIGSDLSGVKINQDAYFARVDLTQGASTTYDIQQSTNGIYVLLISGWANVNGHVLESRDGLAIEGETKIDISSLESSEVLILEVPMSS